MGAFSETFFSHRRLQERIAQSKEFLATAKDAIANSECGKRSDLCIFAAGSLGRFETGNKSDIDLFLISDEVCGQNPTNQINRLEEIQIFSELIGINRILDLPEFSGDGRFLKIHKKGNLIDATGDSSRDDSENYFTTRLLLLLESQPLSNESLYRLTINNVLEHYFRDKEDHNNFQPLFLLNDILRYWRTLCLNYERDRTQSKPWWKKNFNLRFSRKLTVFSTVLAIVTERVSNIENFRNLAGMIPLERLTMILDHLNDESLLIGFQELLDNYEKFLAAKSKDALKQKQEDVLNDLRQRSQAFGDFFYNALNSKKIDRNIVKFVMI